MINYYYDKISQLLGGKIISSFYMYLDKNGEEIINELTPNTDFKEMHQHNAFLGMMVMLPNKNVKGVIVMQDEEGNGPGALDICDLKVSQTDLNSMIAKMATVANERSVDGKEFEEHVLGVLTGMVDGANKKSKSKDKIKVGI